MLVLHDLAHSAPGRKGAVTAGGITEREVAARADEALRGRLLAVGHTVESISGVLERNVRVMNDTFVEAQGAGEPVCAVSLHFNSTPLEDCPACSGRRHMGGVCACGAPSQVRWQFGHRALVRRDALHSHWLAREILREVGRAIPWSKRRELILAPEPNQSDERWPNNLAWINVFRPSALIEIGHGPDPRFAKWIKEPINQHAYGSAAAEGIIRWHDAMVAGEVPLADWKK